MNTLILEQHQFIDAETAHPSERQAKHIKEILKLKSGDSLTVGRLNGMMGQASYQYEEGQARLCDISLNISPPKALPLTLILAMPRPQMLKRILQTVAIFGIKELILIHTQKVEKSFWQSPSASDDAIHEQLLLGLEQAKATQLPIVKKYKQFKPFIEDSGSFISAESKKFIAHPGDYPWCPSAKSDSTLSLAVGPEGGFTEYEFNKFVDEGFQAIQLGQRILKVETAVTALLGRLI